MNDVVQTRAWDPEGSEPPAHALVGHLDGRWTLDQESIDMAVLCLIAAPFVFGGLDPEDAFDAAVEMTKDGGKVLWDGENLSFEGTTPAGFEHGDAVARGVEHPALAKGVGATATSLTWGDQ